MTKRPIEFRLTKDEALEVLCALDLWHQRRKLQEQWPSLMRLPQTERTATARLNRNMLRRLHHTVARHGGLR